MASLDILRSLFALEVSSPRIFIRPFTGDDLDDDYVSWFDDQSSFRFLDAARSPVTKDSLEESFRKALEREESVLYGIFNNETKVKIGTARIGNIDFWDRVAWIGYFIGSESSRGKGLGSEAVSYLTDAVLASGLLRKLYAGVAETNRASLRVLEKSGFSRIAVFPGRFFDGADICDSHIYEKSRISGRFGQQESVHQPNVGSTEGGRN